jgi:1A family penicillin-binding protein
MIGTNTCFCPIIMTSSTVKKQQNKKILLDLLKKTLLGFIIVGIFVTKIIEFYATSIKRLFIVVQGIFAVGFKLIKYLSIYIARVYLITKHSLASFSHKLTKSLIAIILIPKRLILWASLILGRFWQTVKKHSNVGLTNKKKKTLKTYQKKKNIKKHKKLAQVGFLTKFAFFMLGGLFATASVLLPLEVYRWYRQLPRPEMLLAANHNSTKILDRKGRLLYEIYNDKQYEYATLNKIPVELVHATIATEDKDFYQHKGIKPLSIVRAAKATFLDSEVQGASTITQQLIKNVLLTPERTYTRKIKEASIALMVEKKYSKAQIMELYLNNAPYGGTAWGVQAASQKFFAKNVWELDLAQSSMIAGLPLSPSEYNPFNDLQKAKARQRFVLSKMVEQGYVTQKEADSAYAQELEFASQKEYIRAPHFVNYIRDELVDTYGPRMVEVGGLTVTTSLDLDLQEKVQKIVTEEVANSGHLNISNGAALVVDAKTNEILAYVGSKNYFATDYDGAYDIIRAYRQPGSSIKPLAYILALESGMTPATTLNDAPIAINTGTEVYKPVNYDGAFHGNVSLRSALANSYNIPAVRLSVRLGPDAIVAAGKKAGLLGWETDGSYGYSVVLGGKEARLLDMVNLYTVFARGGEHVQITGLRSVKDSNGFEIYSDQRPKTAVFSSGAAYLISNILSDNRARTPAFGPSSALVVDDRRNVAVKTGTTDLKKDNWTIGYTPSYAVGVWVGNNNSDPMSPNLASGLSGAAPIWHDVMQQVLEGTPDEEFPQPVDVIKKNYKECDTSEVFISGTEPSTICKKPKRR